jgi:hypothetical protein
MRRRARGDHGGGVGRLGFQRELAQAADVNAATVDHVQARLASIPARGVALACARNGVTGGAQRGDCVGNARKGSGHGKR